VVQRHRARSARSYFQAYAAACALHFIDKALAEVRAGTARPGSSSVPRDSIGCGFTEAVRGVLSHHLVIRDGKIANYHPYPPPLERQPARQLRDTRALRGLGAGAANLRRKPAGEVQRRGHHALGPQLRSLLALRRSHVPGKRARCWRKSTPPWRSSIRRSSERQLSHG